MNIYVDELPKNCAESECPFNYDICHCRLKEFIDVGDKKIEYFYENCRHETCPLLSLSDYTKQVRKEVVGDLKEELKKNGKCSIRVNGTMDFFIELDKLNAILDQIQGE